MKHTAIKHKTNVTESSLIKEEGDITNSALSKNFGVAVCIYDCGSHTEYVIPSHEEGDNAMDRSMVEEFRKHGQIITCGQTVYSQAQKYSE